MADEVDIATDEMQKRLDETLKSLECLILFANNQDSINLYF